MDGKLRIKTELEDKSFEAQIKELELKLNTMVKTLETEAQIPISARMDESERQKLESDIEKTKNKIISLKEHMQDLPEDEGEKIGKGFEKGMKSLKRFGLSLFSLGSIYALVSKASNSYLSQDLELSQKLQNVWVGLGSFLAPAIEYISDILLKGLGYLNEFIKALTGIDFIARANAKALDKQSEAQKKLNKNTLSFDELNIAQNNSNNQSSSNGLINIPELDNNLILKLQEMATWLKENWDWIKKVGIALGVTFGISKLSGLISNIGSLIGSATLGTGLAGLSTALLAVAAVSTISLVIEKHQEVKQQLDELNKTLDNNIENSKNLTDSQVKLSDAFWKARESGKEAGLSAEQYADYLQRTTDSIYNQYNALEDGKGFIEGFLGINKKNTEQQRQLAEQLKIVTTDYEKLYKQGLLNDEQVKSYKDSLEKQITIMEELGENTTDLRIKYLNLTGEHYQLKLTATLKDEVSSKMSEIIKKFSDPLGFGGGFSILSTIKSLLGGSGGGGKRFALGGIVTQPTRAVIGEAGYPEAVLPLTQDYLSTLAELILQSKSGGNGSNVTNIYIDGKLIQRQISKTSDNYDFLTNS